MLSNAMDFRTRRKSRPKSADCSAEEARPPRAAPRVPVSPRSASVTDLLETISLSPGPAARRPLAGHHSAPDLLPARRGHRARLSAAASAKQKLSTRFQPQRKPQHRGVVPPMVPPMVPPGPAPSSVRRAKTFSLGGQAPGHLQTAYKTLPKQASSRSLGSTSTDSSQGSHSTASSRKSSNSSSLSSDSAAKPEVSHGALEEIAAFERFIESYFELSAEPGGERSRRPLPARHPAATTALSEVLELSI